MSTSDPHRPAAAPYHHGDLRRALIAAARTALDEDGLERLSLREIARRAGVSPAAPYRHFASLGELLAAVATDGFDELAANLDAAWSDAALDPLAALGRAYVHFARANPRLYRLMFGAGVDAGPDTALRQAGRAAFARLVAAVDPDRALDEHTVRTAAVSAWAHVHGLALLLLDRQIPRIDAVSEDALVTAITDQFVRGLRATL